MSSLVRLVPGLLLAALSSLACGASNDPETTLRWRNGETLAGEVVEATAQDLSWKSPLFEEPLLLGWPALRRIDSTQPTVPSKDPFSIALRDGSHIYGDLKSITADAITIESTRHGTVQIKRAAVLSVRRTRSDTVIFNGPAGDVGWTANRPSSAGVRSGSRSPAVPELRTGPGGALLLPYWNSSAALNFTPPEAVLVDFRIRSSKRLDFQLALTGAAKQRLSLETWGNALVLSAVDSFSSLRKISEDTRELALRLGWNLKTGKCAVFSDEGETLAEWQVPEDARLKNQEPPGLRLYNKGRDLTMDVLKVRPWDGTPPPKAIAALPRVELSDGRVLAGEISSRLDGAITLASTGDVPEQTFPVAEITEIVFSSDRPGAAGSASTLSYADGTLIHGRLTAIKDGAAVVEVPFTDAPLTARMDALRQLLKEPVEKGDGAAPPLLESLDKLVAGEATLHGKLSGNGDPAPAWLPVGGLRPAKLSRTVRAEVQRAYPADAQPAFSPALFYLRQGDVLPGTLRAIDSKGVEFESSITAERKLSVEDLDAIYLGAASQGSIKGFNDPGWRLIKGAEKTLIRKDDAITLLPEHALSHPSAMQSSEIKFDLKSTDGGYGAIRLRLFCGSTETAKSVNLLIMRMGERLTYGIEDAENEMQGQRQTNAQDSGDVPVKITINENAVSLHLNDLEVYTHPVPANQRQGYGLILEPGTMWGNPVQPISLSGFSATADPGGAWVPDVNPETRLQTLTVPRFRKETPPRHVLIATNGDLLRGEIEAMTSTHIGFRSGLESLRIPRDRVRAAVWLRKPEEGGQAKPTEAARPAWFDQMLENQARFSETDLSGVVNYLRNQVPGLKFRLPEKQIPRRQSIGFNRQTVGSALEMIAAVFEVRYKIDDTGTVIFEGGRDAGSALAERVYLLKSAEFPGVESLQATLVGKGISFPKEASVQWQPERRRLVVVNSPANLEKVDLALEEMLGDGGFLVPSHWFQLSNGARLGLKVERFEPEFVLGNHPVYGQCRIPFADVLRVHSSSPPTTAAMRALTGWQLAYAPEPVLPESGGESSPALGKEAKPIKLPLLAGGEFELAKQQGKVVVLDFWATWCGPCVKSLPGIITAMAEFSPEHVTFIGINQGEPAETVKRFIETRDWKLTVALDTNQSVGRAYGVEGIPHTVVIGRDGKVAWVKTGYTPTVDKEVSDAVKRLLEPLQAQAAPSAP